MADTLGICDRKMFPFLPNGAGIKPSLWTQLLSET